MFGDGAVTPAVDEEQALPPFGKFVPFTPQTSEALGVQGLQQMINAESALIDSGSVDVISQSFGSGEGAFNSGLASLKQLRTTFEKARANKVTVLADRKSVV